MKPTLLFVILFVGFYLLGCGGDAVAPQTKSSSVSMHKVIDSIYENMSPRFAMYDNKSRAELLGQKLRQSQTPRLVFDYAKEKLNAGETQDAIAVIENILKSNPTLQSVNERTRTIHEFLGICYLRVAEQNNCLNYHSPKSCIVPLRDGGIHIEKAPAERAREIYTSLFNLAPSDLEVRWLLNISYMALGKYPSEVPSDIYIPLEDAGRIKELPNIASNLGVDMNGLSGSVIADDFTNNGYLDILVSSWGRYGSIKIYHNRGEEGFVDQTADSNLDSVYGGLNIKQADFNNDGWMDFIILRGAWKPNLEWGIPPNSLMKNNGDGTFSDVTVEAGLYNRCPTQSAVWLDYDLDGFIDLFIANETTKSSRTPFPCELYRNQGNGTFINLAEELGVDYIGYFKGVISGDIDRDGKPDIFLSNLDGDNILLKNEWQNGKAAFVDITASAGVEKPYAAFPAWFFDYNQDGFEDIYIATFDSTAFKDQSGQFAASLLGLSVNCESNVLYENQGDGTFVDVTSQVFGLHAISTMGCNYGDFNNSGYPDFYLGTGAPDYRAVVPNRLFINQSGQSFDENTFSAHTGHIQKGHGIAFADFNHNGGQDIYAVMGGAFSGDVFHNALYEVPENGGSWLKLRLVGEKSNRAALGAYIIAYGKNLKGEVKKNYSVISSGASFGGNPTEAHLGLGEMRIIDSLIIQWPNKIFSHTVFQNLEINHRYKIYEDGRLVEFAIQPFTYPQKSNNHHHDHHM